MVYLMPGLPRINPEDMNMNEPSVRPVGDENAAEEGCCLCGRERWCVRRCERQLNKLKELLMLRSLSDLTYDSAQRMVGG